MEITRRPYQQKCVEKLNALPSGSKVICALAMGLPDSFVALLDLSGKEVVERFGVYAGNSITGVDTIYDGQFL